MTGSTAEDVSWTSLDEPSGIGAARRAAERLASTLGFPATRVAEVGLAVTEISSNVQRHGRGGTVLLRALRGPAGAAVEVVAMDTGPGIPDMREARRDGSSSAGTLGIGMGAIDRLADTLEISSRSGRGTVLVARFDPTRRTGATSPVGEHSAGITRALAGEDVCGDAYGVHVDGARTWLVVADGSGHGPLAAAASRDAIRVFTEHTSAGATTPETIMAGIHTALLGGRGAAVSIALLDSGAGRIRYVGVGNISGAVLHDGEKKSMVSIGGVAGYLKPTIRGFDHDLPAGATIVMHSDGVRPRWAAQDFGHLTGRAPLLLAATLLRDAGVRQDDACVLVGRPQ